MDILYYHAVNVVYVQVKLILTWWFRKFFLNYF